jgi:hypothetical protein
MSKRTLDALGATPVPKQPRVGDSTPSTTSARPHGRVVLDVGGTRFVSSKSTLERTSSYFRALLSRWDESGDEPLFIDADADAFREILSYMRSGTLMLPHDDERLCARVLCQAEYLGMDGLLDEVKAQAYANLHPGTHEDEARPLARAFDEEIGSLTAAIRSKVLPDKYLHPAPPDPPARTIKALLPAAPGYRAVFTDGCFDYGEAKDEDGNSLRYEALHIVNWALVEYRDGSQRVDAVVQRDLDDTRRAAAMFRRCADATTHSHLQLASEYMGTGSMELSSETKHWVVVPPRPPGQMLPIPPGSVRGLWAKPALSGKDVGKTITIVGTQMTVDGDVRTVEWHDDAPVDVTNATVSVVVPWDEEDSCIWLDENRQIELPRLAGDDSSMQIDLAFASVQTDGSGDLETAFYMPLHTKGIDIEPQTKLAKATTVQFGDLRFSHFVGAKRS